VIAAVTIFGWAAIIIVNLMNARPQLAGGYALYMLFGGGVLNLAAFIWIIRARHQQHPGFGTPVLVLNGLLAAAQLLVGFALIYMDYVFSNL